MRTEGTRLPGKAGTTTRVVEAFGQLGKLRTRRKPQAHHPRPPRPRKQPHTGKRNLEGAQPRHGFGDEPHERRDDFLFDGAEKAQREMPAIRSHPANGILPVRRSQLLLKGPKGLAKRGIGRDCEESSDQDASLRWSKTTFTAPLVPWSRQAWNASR